MHAFTLNIIAVTAILAMPGPALAQMINTNPNAPQREEVEPSTGIGARINTNPNASTSRDEPLTTGAGARINSNPNASPSTASGDSLSGSATGSGGKVTRNTTETGPRVQIPSQSSQIDSFIEANIISVFYHELGHAVIDIEEVPIFAQEEDAADVFSIFLIDALFEDDSALALAHNTAAGMLAEAEYRESAGADVAWWDTHGADEQRFFNTVCLFYGADPKGREGFAKDLGLPEQRAAFCPDEFEQANASWGSVLLEMTERGGGDSLSFNGDRNSMAAQVLIQEIAELNALLRLDAPLIVTVESCGEPNAFYIPSEDRVIFCSEFESHLRHLAGRVY